MLWARPIGLLLALPWGAAPLAGQGAPITFQTVTAGLANTCALTTTGAAYCWGINVAGELGTTARLESCKNNWPCASHPIPVEGGHTFTAIGVGAWHACGLTASGEVFCWGDDEVGQTGTDAPKVACPIGPTTTCQLVPFVVSGGRHFTAIAIGAYHNCALDTEGVAYCWGWNVNGALGRDSTGETCQWHGDSIQTVPCATTPRAVEGPTHFRSLAAGSSHTCGIAVDSLLYCWGDNQAGELGPRGGGAGSQPTVVMPNVKVTAVAAGADKTCAIEANGVVRCWGSFMAGPDLRVTDPTPRLIGDSTQHYTAITVGGEHACALTVQGTAYCWGEGREGQLGIGGFGIAGLVYVGRQGSNEPRKVSGDRSYKAVSAGRSYTCAVGADSALYCWGSSDYSALGMGGDKKKGKPEAVRLP